MRFSRGDAAIDCRPGLPAAGQAAANLCNAKTVWNCIAAGRSKRLQLPTLMLASSIILVILAIFAFRNAVKSAELEPTGISLRSHALGEARRLHRFGDGAIEGGGGR